MNNNYIAAQKKQYREAYRDGRFSAIQQIDKVLKLMPENEAKYFMRYWEIQKEIDEINNNKKN